MTIPSIRLTHHLSSNMTANETDESIIIGTYITKFRYGK